MIFCWKVVGCSLTWKHWQIFPHFLKIQSENYINFVHESSWIKFYHCLKKIPVIVVLIGIRFGAGSPWMSQTSGFCNAHLLICKDDSSWTVCLSFFVVREFQHLINTFELINTLNRGWNTFSSSVLNSSLVMHDSM